MKAFWWQGIAKTSRRHNDLHLKRDVPLVYSLARLFLQRTAGKRTSVPVYKVLLWPKFELKLQIFQN